MNVAKTFGQHCAPRQTLPWSEPNKVCCSDWHKWSALLACQTLADLKHLPRNIQIHLAVAEAYQEHALHSWHDLNWQCLDAYAVFGRPAVTHVLFNC